MAQTTVQNKNAIRFGSGKLEIGPNINNLINIGAVRNALFREEWEDVEVRSDNAGVIKVGIKEHVAFIECDMMEVNLETMKTVRGNLDTLTTVAGEPTSIEDESHVLESTDFVRLQYRNGDGTEVGSIVVKDENETILTRNTDYVLAIDSVGYTCIARIENGTLSSGDEVKVSYQYTPTSAITMTSGGRVTISDRVIRITNINENEKEFRITLYKATINEGTEIEFPGDDDDDPAMPRLVMKGILDTTRDVGDQLFEIYDEQGVE